MRSLSCISLGLSLSFGCLLVVLVVQIFYLFWWKKRVIGNGGIEEGYSNPTKELSSNTLCWKKVKKPSSLSTRMPLNLEEPQAQTDFDINLWDNPLGEEEDSIDIELFRLQQLSGPPRSLCTIEEETYEDLEAEETPYLTPIGSPSYYFTPPLTPLWSSQNHQKFVSVFELASDAEFNKMRSSPPPTFKFLRDAEEKLFRRKINEEIDRCDFKNDAKLPSSLIHPMDEESGSVITILVSNNREKDNVPYCPASSSHILHT